MNFSPIQCHNRALSCTKHAQRRFLRDRTNENVAVVTLKGSEYILNRHDVLNVLPLAIRDPSGENLAQFMGRVWPRNRRVSLMDMMELLKARMQASSTPFELTRACPCSFDRCRRHYCGAINKNLGDCIVLFLLGKIVCDTHGGTAGRWV